MLACLKITADSHTKICQHPCVKPGCCSQVSRTAKMMITQGGFSKKLGQIAWSGGNQNTFVGQQMGQPSDCSGETSDEIDQEVKALVDRAYR